MVEHRVVHNAYGALQAAAAHPYPCRYPYPYPYPYRYPYPYPYPYPCRYPSPYPYPYRYPYPYPYPYPCPCPYPGRRLLPRPIAPSWRRAPLPTLARLLRRQPGDGYPVPLTP